MSHDDCGTGCLVCSVVFGAPLCDCGHNVPDHEHGPCEECGCAVFHGESAAGAVVSGESKKGVRVMMSAKVFLGWLVVGLCLVVLLYFFGAELTHWWVVKGRLTRL